MFDRVALNRRQCFRSGLLLLRLWASRELRTTSRRAQGTTTVENPSLACARRRRGTGCCADLKAQVASR